MCSIAYVTSDNPGENPKIHTPILASGWLAKCCRAHPARLAMGGAFRLLSVVRPLPSGRWEPAIVDYATRLRRFSSEYESTGGGSGRLNALRISRADIFWTWAPSRVNTSV
jgi:hypothetical protein